MSADYELQLEEDCHFVEVFPAEGTAAILSVPGALAPISNIGKLWNSLVRWILSGKSGFARFLRTLGRHEPLADKGTAQPLWPVPAPYPQWMMRVEKSKANYKQMYVEKAVNLMILSSSWLHLGKPLVAPATLALGSSLTKKQWGVVKRYERLISDARRPKWRACLHSLLSSRRQQRRLLPLMSTVLQHNDLMGMSHSLVTKKGILDV